MPGNEADKVNTKEQAASRPVEGRLGVLQLKADVSERNMSQSQSLY